MYGKPGTWVGKKFTDDHKKNLSEALKGANKGKLSDGNNPAAKKVINLSTGEIFDTIRLAEKNYNIPNKVLNSVLRKKEKIYGEHYWDYVDNVNLENLELKIVDIDRRHRKKVLCTTDNRVYNSISEVAKDLNCCRKSIRKACNENIEFRGKLFKYMI